MRRLPTLTALALTALLAASAAQAARAATPAIEPAECARMLADDGVAILRSSSRAALRREPQLKIYVFQAGRATLTITARRHGRSITIARAQARFAAPGARRVHLRITAAGRRALAGEDRLTLRVRANAIPDQDRPATVTRSVRI